MVQPSADDFERIARDECRSAVMLVKGRLYQQAFGHAGMAVEMALKCRISRVERFNAWPERSQRRDLFTHDLGALARIGGLEASLLHEIEKGSSFGLGWLVLKDWHPEVRYEGSTFSLRRARDAVKAIENGELLEWLMKL